MKSTQTELFAAIKAGDARRVSALVGADGPLVDARDEAGQSAILTAVYHGRREIADLLIAHGASLTLFEASAAGVLDRAEHHLASGADVNAFSSDGWTALHLASFFGHQAVAELLLSHGADASARSRNSNGNTPLHAALATNHAAIGLLLMEHGVDVNAPDAAGFTPLHLAAAAGNVDVIRALIARGADPAAANHEGVTPLALATTRGRDDAAALLQELSAAQR